jgi:2-phospho-L-lactate guanylyltransferase
VRWTVLIPVKSLTEAKSRLTGASVDDAGHRRLVAAIREDTIAAARATTVVARLVLVTDGAVEPGDDLSFTQSRPGLNAALTEAASDAARRWPDDGIAALVGDLPALRPQDLASALHSASGHQQAFVPDAAGTGTTLLTALPGHPLAAQFGPGSAGRHHAVATPIDAGARLRHDVDTPTDLDEALPLGIGPRTLRELEHPSRPAVALHGEG